MSPYLFKMIADDLGGSPLRRKVAQILQSLSSTPVTGPYILKAIHVVLFIYLSLKSHFTIIIPMYYMV